MYSNITGAFVGIGLIVFGIVGCCNDNTTEVLSERNKAINYAVIKGNLDFVRNARAVGSGGHIMYDIDKGTVTCIEHQKRAEMACWKNGKHATADVNERTSYQ